MFDGEYHVHHGDCIPHMLEDMPPQSVDMSVFSPPFPAMYAYTSEAGDIGNSEDLRAEAKVHLSYFYNGLARVLKPGRVAVVHVMQLPRLKRSGGVGLCDFRGMNIRIGERAGLVYEYDWMVRKNPQAQAIRTKSRELQFSGLETDRARTRGTLCDYLIKFRAPGDNDHKITSPNQVSRNDWIDWAEGAWMDISETDTLNTGEAKSEDDVKHICPLQLEVIRRCVLLFSDPGDIVFSPFTGIGSEGYSALGGVSPKTGKAIKEPRRFYGCELKAEYHAAALRNLDRAIAVRDQSQANLFTAGAA
jgi:hypothetical protein